MAKHVIHVRNKHYELIGSYDRPFVVGELIAGISNRNCKLEDAIFWRVLKYDESTGGVYRNDGTPNKNNNNNHRRRK